MTTLNGKTNARSMNGLTTIYADEIVSDTIDVVDANVSNDLTVGGTLSIPSFSDVGNTLTDYGNRLTGITYTAGTDTTNIDNNVNVTKTLSIPSYTDVKTSLDTLFTRTTNQSWTNNNTTFATDYIKVGYTQANATPIFILGKTPNIFNPSISTFVRNGLYFTSPTPTPPAVGIGMVSVIDQLWDCGVNVSNVGVRDSTKQGVQFRFDSRSTEKVFQIQTQEKVTNTVRIAIAALDNGHIDIEYRLNMLANANIQMSTGSGIINQVTGGSGTNQLKATNIYSTLSIPSYSDVGATLTSYGNSISSINTTLTGISYDSLTDTTTIDNNVTIPNGDLTLGTGNLIINNNFIATDIEVSNSLVCDPNVDLTFSSGSGIINQIIPSSSGTNKLKNTNIIGLLDVSGNINFTGTLTQNGNPYVANAGTIAITSDNTSGNYYIPFTKTTASSSNSLFIDDTTDPLTYNPSTGGLAVGPITMNSNADLTLQGTGRIVQGASGGTNSLTSAELSSTAKIVGTTTIGSNALTTTFNTRAFNVLDSGGGIRLGRLGTNAAFIELMNFTADGLTENRNATISGSTSTEDRFRFFFRTPAPDLDVMLLRRTQANIYTPLDVSGNITQSSGNIISQTGTGINLMKDITMNAGATLTMQTSGIISQTGTGTNTMKGITLNNDHLLTLQGVGRIVFPDNSVMRTYDEQPVSDIDMHDYLRTQTTITSTFDMLYANAALYSAATSNVARFAAVKLKRGQIITGIGFYTGTAGLHRVALYQKGNTSARLAQSNQFTTTANSMNYANFTATYTIPTTDIYYVSSIQNAASQTYAYSNTNDRLNYGLNTMTNGKLDKRSQSASLSGGTYPANILSTQVFNFENFVFYYVIF